MLLVAALIAPLILGSPAPAPTSSPLREIGRVRANASCPVIIVHANSAIHSALNNDATVGLTVHTLRTVDLETNVIDRRNAIDQLTHDAIDLSEQGKHGVDEVKRLRELAAKTSDPAQKAELRTFADALGGALNRQLKLARDLNGFLSYLDFRDMDASPHEDEINRAALTPDVPSYHFAEPIMAKQAVDPRGTPNQMAVAAADDFVDQMTAIGADEAKAAEHTDGAITGCPL